MIRCGICGQEFKDNQIDEYINHVTACANKKMKEEANKQEMMKKDINEIDKIYKNIINLNNSYKALISDFKKKYPDEYFKLVSNGTIPEIYLKTSKDYEDFINCLFGKPTKFQC